MHESSLAKKILRAVLDEAAREKVARIRVIRGSIAETERLSLDSIALHFQALAHGTVAEGATLELAVRHVEARCLACGASYRPEHHVVVCPSCASTEAALAGPVGVAIDTMVVEG